MRLLFTLATAALLPLFALGDDNALLKQGDILEPGTTLKSRDGSCQLSLQRDGNLISRRRGPFWTKPASWEPIHKSVTWTSGAHKVGDYHATLTTNGNLQVLDGTKIVYSTHVYGPSHDNAMHELRFTETCALRIMRREEHEEEFRRVWTNFHVVLDNFSAQDSPGLDNVLQRGEYFTYPGQNYGTVCGTGADFCMDVPFSLRLQHDCNLVTFVGHDHGDVAAVVWSAGVARPNAVDCYLLVDSNDVALYEGSFDPSRPVNETPPGKYWSVPRSFFDVDGYRPGGNNGYQILIGNSGEMYLDWD